MRKQNKYQIFIDFANKYQILVEQTILDMMLNKLLYHVNEVFIVLTCMLIENTNIFYNNKTTSE